MTDPYALVESFEQRVAEKLRKAEAAQADVAAVTATVTSDDGSVTVTVNPAGVLQNVSFGRSADKLDKDKLAEVIMSATRRAQADAARQVADIMAPVLGADSEAMQLLKSQLPDIREPDPAPAKHRPVTVYNDERLHSEAPPTHPRQPRPAATEDDEHDYEQQTLLKKKR